ncbi:hypothetical protein QFC21_005918 [Naganishia friedmannii]|uniref:Uncharacterized protein n=1 Tax=Naganishia friedmannii TaxID=89922 RepID=A0ACC2V6G0_9TREE|nr:hypothetical protein QFC21_005918 [Naganishia friedmannii]
MSMNANANYSYPLSRYPPATSPKPNNINSRPATQQHDAASSMRNNKTATYGSSRTTSARPTAAPTCFVLPKETLSDAAFSLDAQARTPGTAGRNTRRIGGHVRKDSRFDDASEEVEPGSQLSSAGSGSGDLVGSGGRRPFANVSINIQFPDQQLPLQTYTQPPLSQVQTQTHSTKPSLKPSTRNYSLASSAITSPPNTRAREQRALTPNRLRKANTNASASPSPHHGGKPAAPAARRGTQPQVQVNVKRSSWKIGGTGGGGAAKVLGKHEKKEERYKEATGGAQIISTLGHAFEPPPSMGTGTALQFRSKLPLGVPNSPPRGQVPPPSHLKPKPADKADMVSMKSLALSIASDPFADPRMRVGKKGSVASLGRRKEDNVAFAAVSEEKQGAGKRSQPTHHGLPVPPVPSAVQQSTAPPVISKKKSMLAFASSIGQKKDSSSSSTAVGKRIGGLVKMPSGGFGLRRGAKHGAGEAPGDISFSSGHVDSSDGDSQAGADTSVVAPLTLMMRERQSTDSNFSMMSDWTITNLSDISGDLPGVDGERYNGMSEAQNGGVRKLGKKKSFAAAGVFLGKILHGAGAGAGEREKKERRKSEVAAYKELPKRLRNEASTMTLRPTNAPAEDTLKAADQSRFGEAHVRQRSPSPASTIRFKDTEQFQAIHGPTPTALGPSPNASALHFNRLSHKSMNASETGYNRAKSPELPSLHFPKLSYTGTNFRADLSLVGNALEMAPPVPPIPATFTSPVGNTVRHEPRLFVANPDERSLASARSPAPAYTESMPLRAGTSWANAMKPAHVVQSSQDYSQYSQESSGDSSLVHVEHALDIDDEYSFISKNSSIVNGGEKRVSAKLPWRRSVQGVFTTGENEARREESHVLVDSLLGHSSLDKKPSLVDLKKVSNMTGDLRTLVAAYNASPSTLSDFVENPMDGAAREDNTGIASDLAVRLDSPSSSHIMDHDSPTPMRKYGYDRQGKGSRLMTPQLEASPLRISPLRLALGNSAVKSQQDRYQAEDDSHLSRRIFEDNPFLTLKKASAATSGTSVPSQNLGDELALCRQRRLSNASSSDEDESPLARRIDHSGDSLGLPPLRSVSMENTRASKNTQETFSSFDALPRESFDFTEEYRALNENGSRQSFMDELERLGLSSGEDSFRVEKTELKGGLGVNLGATLDHCDSTTTEAAGHARRNSYGFNKNFRFGVIKQASCSALSSVSSNIAKQTPVGSVSSPPKDPLPIPQTSSLGFNNRFRFKPNPEDSMFSIATMSSVGPVVDTGIAGTNFVNVFDRDFGAILAARDRTFRSLHHQSSNTSSIDSFSNGPIHLRRPSHARISSFASVASRSGSVQHAPIDVGHRRQQSSLDSNRSILRKVGRPNVDSDRMFETDTRIQLYSIEGSPAALITRNTATKPSKDSILDNSRHLATRDSILDNTEDSIFRSGTRKTKSSTFAIKPIRPLSHISDVTEPKASLSPLGIKTRMRQTVAEDSLLDDSVGEPVKQEEEAVEQCLQADAEASIEDTSCNSNLSYVSGGLRRPARPKNARPSRPSSLLLANPGLPALLSPEHSDFSPHQSTDVHSSISSMVDCDSKSRWSRRLKGLSQLSEHGNIIEKSVPLATGIFDHEQLSLRTERKGGLTRWVDYRRLVEAEVLKSKTTWQDSTKSVQVIAEFVPPSTAEGIRSVIRNSLDLNRPLCEASPGTQITRREQHEIETGMETASPGPAHAERPSTKPLALPTKFMRADSAKSGSRMDDSPAQTATTRPVSAVFAKFAVATQPSPTKSELANVPLTIKPKPGNTMTSIVEIKKINSPMAMRPRVNSTARRQKLGWTRRKEAGAIASPLKGKRTVAKLSHKSLRDSNKENAAQPQ